MCVCLCARVHTCQLPHGERRRAYCAESRETCCRHVCVRVRDEGMDGISGVEVALDEVVVHMVSTIFRRGPSPVSCEFRAVNEQNICAGLA